MLCSASDKAKLFAKNFSKDSNLVIQVSLYLFSFLELYNISMTLKFVKKVVKNLDLSKVSGPDCTLWQF